MPQHGTICCSFVGTWWLGETSALSDNPKPLDSDIVQCPLPGAGGQPKNGHGLSFTLAQTVLQSNIKFMSCLPVSKQRLLALKLALSSRAKTAEGQRVAWTISLTNIHDL
jgi:hypothetical protein